MTNIPFVSDKIIQMSFHDFFVLHRLKNRPSYQPERPENSHEKFTHPNFINRASLFKFETCLREIVITDKQQQGQTSRQSFEIYSGYKAYEFLLKVASGLESKILGETDVYGQLRQTWKKHKRNHIQRSPLDGIIEKLFEDVKEIRTHFLRGIGGQSYGSLTRRLLRPQRDDSILIVGSGQLASSIIPYFEAFQLCLWSRTSTRFSETKFSKVDEFITQPDEELKRWKSSTHVIVCIPRNEQDHLRIKAWNTRDLKTNQKSRIIHLDCQKNTLGPWGAIPNLIHLDHLFEIQEGQDEIRANQLACAKKACKEKALLRSLGTSISLPHGWEDLTLFA